MDSPQNGLAIDELLVRIFDQLVPVKQKRYAATPGWIAALTEMLHELPENRLTLESLSVQLGIHPVHLCRYFTKHFHCTLGEYLRQLRVERSLNLLRNSRLSLTEIAYRCGFADQSHFNRCFKTANRMTPFQYREQLQNGKA
jgi:AraC family transcriptional regulator